MDAHMKSKPLAMCGNLENLPAAFDPYKARPAWVLWRWELRDGDWTKPPKQPGGANARSDAPQTWRTFPEVLAAFRTGGFNGLGLMTAACPEICALDLDKCRDPATGESKPWAADVIAAANSYVEVTPSGKGFRVLGTGDRASIQRKFRDLPDGCQLEVFQNTNRYITVTGLHVQDTWPNFSNIQAVTEQLIAGKGLLTPAEPTFAPAPPYEPKPGGLALSLLGHSHGGLEELIRTPRPDGERHQRFHHTVAVARRSGWTQEQLEKAMRSHPNGVAAKFLFPADRLSGEIARSWGKVDATMQGAWSAGAETAATAMILDANGRPISSIANAAATIRTTAEWQGVVANDLMAGRVTLMAPLPDATGRRPNNFEPRPLSDTDIVRATEWFQRNGFTRMGKEAVADALALAADDWRFDPLEDKLRSLLWDGRPRIETWLLEYCGAEITATQPEAYIKAAGRRWLMGGAARALRPGCKNDSSLVLVGDQGIGKSTAGRILAYNWFSDSLPPVHSKDAADHLRGVWLVELGEMATASRADVEELKAFLTRTHERFRPAYGRMEIEYPRRCFFLGTSNGDSFLKDETGARRFWPVKVRRIDTERLRADRDQLWAEAVHHIENGERWYLTSEEAQLAAVQQKAFSVSDERAAVLATRLKGRTRVTSLEAADLLGMPSDKKGQMEVASMLRSLGWSRQTNGVQRFWAAPELATSSQQDDVWGHQAFG